MIWVDYLILIVITVSVVISIARGFVREAFSLAGWILAFWVGISLADRFAGLLESSIDTPSIRYIIAFTGLFALTLIVATAVNHLASQLVEKTGLSGTDRMVGIVFGFVRGIIVVAALVFLAGLTALPQDPWWRESLFVEHFHDLARWVSRSVLPPNVAANLL